MVSDSARKRLDAKKAAKSAKLHGSAKPSPAVSASQVCTVSCAASSQITHPYLYFLSGASP